MHTQMSALQFRLLLTLGALFIGVAFVVVEQSRASAHAGHGNEEIGEFDLDAPRIVTPETAKHIGMKVDEVMTGNLEDVLEISGIVRPNPDKHRVLVSRVPGKLLAIHTQVGAAVKKGDLLAELDSPELAKNQYEVRKLEVEYAKLLLDVDRRIGEVARHEADQRALQAQVEVAKKDYQRSESISGEGISVREVESRKAQLAKLEAELESKKVDLDTSKKDVAGLKNQADALKLSHSAMQAIYNIEPSTTETKQVGSVHALYAETDGIVIDRGMAPGSWIQPGDKILTIADYSEVQIEGELPESLISRVEGRSESKVRVRAASNPTSILEGSVKFIAPQLEPLKRTAHLIVDAPNPKGILRGEMWVKLAIVLSAKKDVLLVPKSAVVVDGPVHFVFVEIETEDVAKGRPAKYQKHDIEPGLSNDLVVEVKDGVFPGDRVVSQGAYSLTQLRPKVPAKAAAH